MSWPGGLFERRGHTLGPRDAVCILTHDPKFDVPFAPVAVLGISVVIWAFVGIGSAREVV